MRSFFHAGWRVGFHLFDLITHRRGMQLVNGTALVARLAKSADDLGVQLWVRLAGDAPADRGRRGDRGGRGDPGRAR